MKNHQLFTWICSAMLLFNTIQLQAQTIWTVDNTPNSGAQFTDVQSAINAASNGDTIYVQQSDINYGNFNVNKSLSIIGASHSDGTWYKTQVGAIELQSGSTGTTFQGLDLSAIRIDNSLNAQLTNLNIKECKANLISLNGTTQGGFIDNVLIEGCEIESITASNRVSNVTISNNFISLQGPSATLSVSGNSVIMENNIFFVQNGRNLIFNQSNPPVTVFNSVIIKRDNNLSISGSYSFNNCHIYNINDFNAVVNITQANIAGAQTENTNNCTFSGDPMFITAALTAASISLQNSNFGLQANSPLIGAGANGGDIGFAAGYIFKYLGNPKGYPEVKISNYTGASSSNGTVTFDIEARSH